MFNKPEGTLLTPGEIRVLYGTGDTGRWNEVTVLPQSEEIYFPNDVVVEDMDDDGDLDLLVGSRLFTLPRPPERARFEWEYSMPNRDGDSV